MFLFNNDVFFGGTHHFKKLIVVMYAILFAVYVLATGPLLIIDHVSTSIHTAARLETALPFEQCLHRNRCAIL